MTSSTSISPPNSVIVVMDWSEGKIPESMNNQLVSATTTCVAIGTQSEVDGQTRITLTDETPSDLADLAKVFDGVLITPSLKLAVYSIRKSVILESPVRARTHLQIWANHEMEPDDIRIIITNPDPKRTSRKGRK